MTTVVSAHSKHHGIRASAGDRAVSTVAYIITGLFTAVGYWNSYFSAIIYITKRPMWPLQLVMRELLFESGVNEMTALDERVSTPFLLKMASIVVASVPIMCVYPFLQRFFMTGLVLGGVKE